MFCVLRAEELSGSWACAQVTPLAAAQVEEQLKMAVEEIVRSPATLLQALMDHSHSGYAQELWAAARQLEKQAPVRTPV